MKEKHIAKLFIVPLLVYFLFSINPKIAECQLFYAPNELIIALAQPINVSKVLNILSPFGVIDFIPFYLYDSLNGPESVNPYPGADILTLGSSFFAPSNYYPAAYSYNPYGTAIFPDGTDILALIDPITGLPKIVYVEPNYIRSLVLFPSAPLSLETTIF